MIEYNKISSSTINIKNSIKLQSFLNELVQAGILKDIWIIQSKLNIVNHSGFLNLSFYYQTSKLFEYKRTTLDKFAENDNLKKKYYIDKNIERLSNILKEYSLNTISINIILLNNLIDSIDLNKDFEEFKQYINIFFRRRSYLYIDFLKITFLLKENHIGPKFYLKHLGIIFKTVPKKSHEIFFTFLEELFAHIIQKNKKISGIRFTISGKLQNMPRASTTKIILGSIPLLTISKNINRNKIHVYNKIGAFGLKLWINYN